MKIWRHCYFCTFAYFVLARVFSHLPFFLKNFLNHFSTYIFFACALGPFSCIFFFFVLTKHEMPFFYSQLPRACALAPSSPAASSWESAASSPRRRPPHPRAPRPPTAPAAAEGEEEEGGRVPRNTTRWDRPPGMQAFEQLYTESCVVSFWPFFGPKRDKAKKMEVGSGSGNDKMSKYSIYIYACALCLWQLQNFKKSIMKPPKNALFDTKKILLPSRPYHHHSTSSDEDPYSVAGSGGSGNGGGGRSRYGRNNVHVVVFKFIFEKPERKEEHPFWSCIWKNVFLK